MSSRLRIDRRARRVWLDDREIAVTPLEHRLLAALHERSPRVVTRQMLLRDVWGASPDLATRSVDAAVKRLRAKLGRASDAIQTVHGLGYSWVEH